VRTTPLLCLVASVLLAAAVLPAADAPAPAAPGGEGRRPAIRFDRMTHDFGKIPSDRKVSVRWVFHNDGDAPLEIVAVRPTCGCTVTAPQDDLIPPGGTGALEVTFDPAGQQGSVRKSLAVMSNDPRRPSVLLTLRAEVQSTEVPEGSATGHPPIAGQSLLMGSCGTCHAAPAAGKSGPELYAAICAACHGADGRGARAPSLRVPDWLAGHTDEQLAAGIAYGTANPRMPGYLDQMGGPLSTAQIDSLVRLLRTWGPAPGGGPR